MQNPYVSIVIPCLDEEANVAGLLEALDDAVRALRAAQRPAEVIAVDDGSRDATWRRLCEARAARPWLHLVRLARNYGQSAAMAAGIDAARGEVIVPMDADLQNDPRDIPALVARLEDGYDVVSGWRRERQDNRFTRTVPSRAANWLIGRVGGVRLHDYGCTLKAYRREFVRTGALCGDMHRLIPLYARHDGARITEQVVRHHPRRAGHSKYGLGRIGRVPLDLLTARLLTAYATRPLHLFGRFALPALVLGVALLAIGCGSAIAGATSLPWLACGAVACIIGAQLIATGLVAELQVRGNLASGAQQPYRVAERVDGVAVPIMRPLEDARERPAA